MAEINDSHETPCRRPASPPSLSSLLASNSANTTAAGAQPKKSLLLSANTSNAMDDMNNMGATNAERHAFPASSTTMSSGSIKTSMREDSRVSNGRDKKINLPSPDEPQLTPGQKLRQSELLAELFHSEKLLNASRKRGRELEADLKAAKRACEEHHATQKELVKQNNKILAKMRNIPNM
ncbi:hypothetical protein PHISCL_00445 [Aspergillus sclerotialis]|uniref:Uncharacterized protein n=1 Tax=Aspergillus sclerotialis TaxID=2070753 RepID=A0A3A3A686_9EURO|nr:hypothetical protein PHISCL_00445 [Aspergillus sclerotialis]